MMPTIYLVADKRVYLVWLRLIYYHKNFLILPEKLEIKNLFWVEENAVTKSDIIVGRKSNL